MNVLVTAFGPFSNFKRNPSEMVLEYVRQQGRGDSLVTEWAVLPVAFGAIDRFIAGIPRRKYDVIIHTGVSSGSKKPSIELCASNRVQGRDVHGVELEGPIETKGPALLTSRLVSHLRDGLCCGKRDIESSEDAGAYLCNYVYYKSLRRFGSQSGVAFLHLADFINHPDACSLEAQAGMLGEIIEQAGRLHRDSWGSVTVSAKPS